MQEQSSTARNIVNIPLNMEQARLLLSALHTHLSQLEPVLFAPSIKAYYNDVEKLAIYIDDLIENNANQTRTYS